MHPQHTSAANGANGDRRHWPLLQRLAVVAATILAGLLACGALLAALGSPVTSVLAAPASGPVIYPGGANCTTTLQACIDNSPGGTTILIEPNTYYTNGLTLGKPVSLTGVSSATVILHALANQRVLTITGAAVDSSVIISGLTFAGGHAVGGSCPGGCGGAILITATAQPLLINLTISNSLADHFGGGLYADASIPLVMSGVAVLSNTAAGYGGGAYAEFGNVTLNGGVFQNNRCAGLSFCYGGGLYAGNNLVATNTQFLSNTNNSSNGYAGGAYAGGNVTLNGGVIQNNQCSGSNSCYGGGLYAFGYLVVTNTQFLSNTNNAGDGYGGGAYASLDVTLNGGLFQNNQCAGSGTCYGGGLYAENGLVVTNTQFLSNTSTAIAGYGGGAIAQFGNVTLNGAVIQNNQCAGSSYCYGGGLYAGGNLLATNTQILSNTNNSSNGYGGGAYTAFGNVSVNGSMFQNNQCNGAGCQGGGLYAETSLGVTNTLFLANTAQLGAGLYQSGGSGRLVNDLFAANQARLHGDALFLASPGAVSLLFTTIASPTLGSGAAIYVTSGTVGITDTIIASYTTGVSQTAGSAYQDYNLFFGNATNTAGAVSGGAHSLSSDPRFVNPAASNYHLVPGSAAIDTGVDVGVYFDIDGDPRPLGAGFDIGFDEANIRHLFLPLVRR